MTAAAVATGVDPSQLAKRPGFKCVTGAVTSKTTRTPQAAVALRSSPE
jgi:hypothetical protein